MSVKLEDEDDYMSEDILQQCANIRPSLLFNRGVKRKHELLKKTEESNEYERSIKRKIKSVRVQEEETRTAGLQKEIGSDNKGFQLLSKMGYKPGSSLGKCDDLNAETKLKEPITIELKSDRMGLGQKTKYREEQLEALKKRQEELQRLAELADPEQFRQRTLANVTFKAIERDVRTAQSACRHLDIQQGKDCPISPWFWPQEPKKVDPSDPDEPSDLGDTRKREILKKTEKSNEHRRKIKSVRVQEEEARTAGLQKEIGSDNKGFQLLSKMGYKPGSSLGKCDDLNADTKLKEPIMIVLKSDRMGLGQKTDDEEKESEDTEPEVVEILETITKYLRSHYFYCIWCGTSYNDKDDFQTSCPGNSRDVH